MQNNGQDQLVPCPCIECDGGLVSSDTRSRHNKRRKRGGERSDTKLPAADVIDEDGTQDIERQDMASSGKNSSIIHVLSIPMPVVSTAASLFERVATATALAAQDTGITSRMDPLVAVLASISSTEPLEPVPAGLPSLQRLISDTVGSPSSGVRRI